MKKKKLSILQKCFCLVSIITLTSCPLGLVNEDDSIDIDDVVISIIDGDFNNELMLSLSCDTEGAVIRYTTDGVDPSINYGNTYVNPIIINQSSTIKAIAYIQNSENYSLSRIVQEVITLNVAEPQLIPGGITFSGTIVVSIISLTDGAYIRYTTDGTIPSETIGQTYDGSFTLSETATVRAKAYKAGYTESDVVYEEYFLDLELPQVSGIIWKGSLSYAPNNPEINWAYYNTSDGISYIYDGLTWSILAQDGNTGESGVDGNDGISIVWKGSLSLHPLSPEENWAYYNTTDKISYIFNGYSWEIITQDGHVGENGTDGIDGLDGISIIWKGSYDYEPSLPELNWGYYNTSEGISYIWTGSDWSIIAKDGGISSVVAPVMIPGGTTFSVPTLVTMFTTTNEAMIRYTIDGSDPDEYNGQLYSEPLLIEYSTTLKAVAYRDGMNTSPITSMNYTFNRVDNPVIDVEAGEYNDIQNVTISTTTAASTIYYTTDGSNPSTTNFTDYGSNSTVVVNVDQAMILKAIAVKEDYVSSNVITKSYSLVALAPIFSHVDGVYTPSQTITISSITNGITIYYTLNGSEPSQSNYDGFGISPVEVILTTNTQLKAIAVKESWNNSSVSIADYIINDRVDIPSVDIGGGLYNSTQIITLTTNTVGALIYYTIDGNDPTVEEHRGSGLESISVNVEESMTIKAIATKDNMPDSLVTSEVYIIDSEAPIIELIDSSIIKLEPGDVYYDSGAIASDNYDGDITSSITVGGDIVDTLISGTYIVTYDVSDSAGNTAIQLIRTVLVLPTYTISYYDNGATSGEVPSHQAKIEDTEIILANNSGSLVRSGFNFVGWNTAEDGTGIDYSTGDIYTNNEDLVLYAKWLNLSFNATDEFSINVSNPNGTWSYGWMPNDFSEFRLYTETFTLENISQIIWYRTDHSGYTPAISQNLGESIIYGIDIGQISLHPSNSYEPSVLRWTAPVDGVIQLDSEFFSGDIGNVSIGIKYNNSWIYQEIDAGSYVGEIEVFAGDTLDFIAYGVWGSGNTPLEVIINYK